MLKNSTQILGHYLNISKWHVYDTAYINSVEKDQIALKSYSLKQIFRSWLSWYSNLIKHGFLHFTQTYKSLWIHVVSNIQKSRCAVAFMIAFMINNFGLKKIWKKKKKM